MPDTRLVDIEALLVDYLEGDDDLDALVDGRISTELPAAFGPEGRVQLFRLGGGVIDAATQHVDRPLVQILTYGATKGEAFDVAAQVLRAILEAPDWAHDLGVVTLAERISGPTWSPDPGTDTPRYLLGVVLTVHPTPE